MNKILVMFGGKSDHPLKWMLKEGFHHCFAAIQSDGYWIELDKVQGDFTVRVMAAAHYDLAFHYEKLGYLVITTSTQRPNVWKLNPFYGNIMVANCVGLVKALLSLNSLALTPFKLYKELTK